MRYGSVCSGVESASLAWADMGWEPQWFSEIDPFPSAVLKHQFPDVPNLGDMTKLSERKEYNDRSIQLLVGGTPCQSFSVAGLREGLDDERGNLAREYCRILEQKRPTWFIWENVPGVLSSNGGRDFQSIIGAFREIGYSIAFRILDAQYFGVPQRRRRVFVVGHLGDWRGATAVLFERYCLQGNIAKGRKKKQISPSATQDSAGAKDKPVILDRAAFNQGENALYDPIIEESETVRSIIARGPSAILPCRMTAFGEYETDNKASTVKARDFKDATDLICVHGTQDPDIQHNKAHTLGRNSGQENVLCIQGNLIGRDKGGPNGVGVQNDLSYTLNTTDRHAVIYENHPSDLSPTVTSRWGTGGGNVPYYKSQSMVRRLTPLECERLMGFPDNWTKIPWKNKPAEDCPDGPRYKACGNSMAVPCMAWIGRRIQQYEDIMIELSKK